MFGLKENSTADREEYSVVALLEDDSVKTEPLDQEKTEREINTQVKTGGNRLKCEDCGKVFGTKNDYERHRLVHTGARPFECEDCGKTFTQKYNLKDHRRIHTDEQLKCDVCDKSFRPGFGTEGIMEVQNMEP